MFESIFKTVWESVIGELTKDLSYSFIHTSSHLRGWKTTYFPQIAGKSFFLNCYIKICFYGCFLNTKLQIHDIRVSIYIRASSKYLIQSKYYIIELILFFRTRFLIFLAAFFIGIVGNFVNQSCFMGPQYAAKKDLSFMLLFLTFLQPHPFQYV